MQLILCKGTIIILYDNDGVHRTVTFHFNTVEKSNILSLHFPHHLLHQHTELLIDTQLYLICFSVLVLNVTGYYLLKHSLGERQSNSSMISSALAE